MRSHIAILKRCTCGMKPRGQSMADHYADVAATQHIDGPYKVTHGLVDVWPSPGNQVLCPCCPKVLTFVQYEAYTGHAPVQGKPLREWVAS